MLHPPPDTALEAAECALLAGIGRRVRTARAGRGMTRKLLAAHSHVSERYLAQLEGGQANPSVSVLAKIADALGLTLTALLHEESAQDIELALLVQRLKHQPALQLRALRQRLAAELDQASVARQGRIALLGLRGAGKSTLGKRLAVALDVPFLELDQEVERDAGTSLSEIFLLYGQAGYRRYERDCLKRLLETHERCVIATGGSLVTESATFDLLLSACTCVWLKAAPEEHMARVVAQGDTRPMAGNTAAMEDLKRILLARAPLYAQADLVIDTASLDADASYARLAQAVASLP